MASLINSALELIWQSWATVMVAAFVIGITIKISKTNKASNN